MGWLKFAVTFMGVLIVIGVTVLVAVIVQRIQGRGQTEAGIARPGTFADRSIDIPFGARVHEMSATGERLVVRLKLQDGRDAVLMVDLATGERLGQITFERAR
jgi:hypothetical protein